MSASDENVLVVPRRLFEELGAFEGLHFDVQRYVPRLLDPRSNFFLPRSAAENDPTHKQIIPYLILRHGATVLHYVRGKSGGEARLHARGSIGIGGHINDGDSGLEHFDDRAYERAILRELHEELAVGTEFKHRIVALLNDDSSDVGRVHLGMVHVVDLAAPRVTAREDAIRDLEFIDVAELDRRKPHLEGWSRYCADHIGHLLNGSTA